MDSVVLNVFKGDWGLASIDLDCLTQLAFCKFANAPVDFEFNDRLVVVNRKPYAALPDSTLRTYEAFTGYLKKHVSILSNTQLSTAIPDMSLLFQNFDPNYHLPDAQKALSLSYQHQVRSSLYPYFILTLVDNEQNFTVIRKLYGQRIAFPFSLLYPGKLERLAKDFKETHYGLVTHEKDENDAHQKATIEARIFLNNMSKRLGDQKFFFGNKPCEFDAHLYAHLAILYHIQLPDNPIQSHIAQCPNLVAYVKRITKEYFSEEAHDSGTVYDFSYNRSTSKDAPDGGASEKKKDRIFQALAVVCGVSMMVLFSLSSGILERGNFERRLEDIGGYDDDDDEEDDDEV